MRYDFPGDRSGQPGELTCAMPFFFFFSFYNTIRGVLSSNTDEY